MRLSDGGYRFGLQFKNMSDAHYQVGEFLESQGNKKSEIIVTAMIEYIRAHPEVLNRDNPVRVIAAYGYSEETLSAKIETMIRKIANTAQDEPVATRMEKILGKDDGMALDALLDGLDRFD